MKYLPTGCIALVLATGCIGYRKVGEPANAGAGPPANSAVLRSGLQPPPVLEIEHKHLHHQLEAALAAGGDTGAAAKK